MLFQDWGMISYDEALVRQKTLVKEVIAGSSDVVVLCEHPAVITLGRKSSEANIFRSREDLAQLGVKVVAVDRGGDVTLHAPGQIVIYPIIDIKRAGLGLKGYLQKLEEVAVDLLNDFGIVAQGDEGRRGVWVGREKIASIGIGVSHWVTYHGMGLNISTDLKLFDLIRPCGLNVRMASLETVLARQVVMADVRAGIVGHCQRIFTRDK